MLDIDDLAIGERFEFRGSIYQYMGNPTGAYCIAESIEDGAIYEFYPSGVAHYGRKLTIDAGIYKHVDSANFANIILNWVEEHGHQSITVDEVNKYLPKNIRLVVE